MQTLHNDISGNFSPRQCTDEVSQKYKIKFDKHKRLWVYSENRGIWEYEGELFLNQILRTEILHNSEYSRQNVAEVIADIKGLVLTDEELTEPPPHLIPFNNLIYDIINDEMIQYSPDYFFINKLAVDYGGANHCPTIDRIFSQLVSGSDVTTLYELGAYFLWRGYPYQKIFCLYGSGGNGKGVYERIMTRLLGESNISTVSVNDLQSNRFSPARLYGKYANFSGEMDYAVLRKTDLLKQTCGEDLMCCERKYREPFNFVNYAKMVFNTNQIPFTDDKTSAYYRRVFLLEFPNTFEAGDNNTDPLLVDNIPQSEIDGLAMVCLGYLKELLHNKFVFTNNEKTSAIREKYERLSDPLGEFIKKFTLNDSNGEIPVRGFMEKFSSEMKNSNSRVWNNRQLNSQMKERGYAYELSRNGGAVRKVWCGLSWKHVRLFPE